MPRLPQAPDPRLLASSRRAARLAALLACRFRFGSPRRAVNLAVDQNSLARYSQRITRRRSILSDFVAFAPCTSVTVWFQALFTSRQGHFSAFTHATSALSVSGRV